MTLIKMYVVGAVKALTADIQRRMAEKVRVAKLSSRLVARLTPLQDLSETAETHLLYSKFRSTGAQIAPLLAELERRASAHPEELSSLLTECQTAYFQCRKSLIAGRLVAEIKALDPARGDLVELVSLYGDICTPQLIDLIDTSL